MNRYQIIGYDITDQQVQISYFNNTMKEPDTVYFNNDITNTEIPLIATFNKNKSVWISPVDNQEFNVWANEIIVRDLLTKASNADKIEYEGNEYDAQEILFKFIKDSVENQIASFDGDIIDTYIAFTVTEITNEVIILLQNIGRRLGIDENKIFVQDYKESFYDYIWPQNSDISNYDVVLFGFKGHNMYAFKFSKEQIVGSRRRDFVKISYDEIENITFDKYGDRQFEQFARSFFGRSVVSSYYLVGDEFDKEWYEETAKFLSISRHGFRGTNLYSKGACYAAMRKSGMSKTNLIYIDEYKTSSMISIKLNNKGNEEWYPILRQGENWYEVSKSVEVIVDQVTHIRLRIDTIGQNMPREEIVPLDGLFDKQRRTCKLNIKLVMFSSDVCKLIVDDEDFGEINKASGYHLEHVFSLDENMFRN